MVLNIVTMPEFPILLAIKQMINRGKGIPKHRYNKERYQLCMSLF